MQGGVIGGICLLAFLLSEGRGEELGDSKQLDESKVSPAKGTEVSVQDSGQSTNDAKSNDHNNINSTLVVNTTNSSLKEANLRKAQQYGAGTTKKEESHFSPLFSSDSTHVGPEHDLERENAQTLPSYFISQGDFEETRRNSKPKEIKARNAEESEYNETNEYPYNSPRESDSTSNESNDMRSGVYYDPSYSPFIKEMSSAKVYASAQASNPNSFGYPSDPVSNSIITASANAQVTSSGNANAQSRVIWPNEIIFSNEIPGSENVIQCTTENEMYHYWSIAFDCMVCICVNKHGILQPLCAKCSGCRKPIASESQTFISEQHPPTPESYVPLPIPDSYVPLPLPDIGPIAPSPPSFIFEPTEEQIPTSPLPVHAGAEASATCSPLPTGQSFTNPLHPCQVCICKETVIAPGKIDAKIECQDNHNCVLPPDVTTIPSIPDVPGFVPLPACEKFPPHVTFPHPTDSCRQCKCSLELSAAGVPEQQIHCHYDTDCVPKIETTSELITPPAPPIPIPVEPYSHPSTSGPPPNAVTPEEPIPWPPISTPAPPLIPLLPKKGPLPGPSPHDSCRPYPPNQPFQHPWDECQVCTCFEIKSISLVNVEISCYTKQSCCIESPDQVITVIAEASSVDNNEAVAYSELNGSPTSTFKPSQLSAYNSDASQNQGYAEAMVKVKNDLYGATQEQAYAQANAIAQNSEISQTQGYAEANAFSQNFGNNPVYPGSYQSANAFSNINDHTSSSANAIYKSPSTQNPSSSGISQNQAYAEANVEYSAPSALSPYNSELSQNQAYAEANAVYNSPSALNPYKYGVPQNQAYAEANAEYNSPSALNSYKYGVPQNQAYAEANAEYNSPSALNSFSSGGSQNLAYAEANADYYNGPAAPSANQPSASYQTLKAKGSINSGGINEKHKPSTVTYKPSLPLGYNTVPQSLGYLEGIAKQDRIISTTFKTPPLYTPYNAELSQNKAYAEAIAQYKDLMNPGLSQNQAIAKANAQYNSLITSTYKPSILNNQYKTEQSQNQVYAQANAKYNDLLTSTPRSPALYNGYNPAVSRNQVYSTANALYKSLALPDKPQLFNPYLAGGSQNQAFSQANAIDQSSLADKNYYLTGPYQTVNGLGSVSNSGDQSIAIAEALSQSQDYTLYTQPGTKVGVNPLSNPSLRYPYPSNNYYQNPQYSSFSSIADSGFGGKYETIPVQYAGKYEFNGQPDAITILSSPNNYNPYTSGYSQGIPASKLYPSINPTRNNHEITSSYHPGQHGGTSTNGQSTSQVLKVTKYQSKSGEGYEGDSAEAK